MTITGIGADPSTVSGDSKQRLSDNYDTFLVLLTAQLQNQDPLAPMDSTQFTQQLVQFSQVEQQIRTNEQLEGLVSQYQSAAAGSALAYLGKDAIIDGDTATLQNGVANWAYTLEDTAENVRLEIRDGRNRTVFEADGVRSEGEHLFTWNGKNLLGEDAPPGVYRLVVTAKDADNEAIETDIRVRETILGVDFTSDDPQVLTTSGTRPLDSVKAIIDNPQNGNRPSTGDNEDEEQAA